MDMDFFGAAALEVGLDLDAPKGSSKMLVAEESGSSLFFSSFGTPSNREEPRDVDVDPNSESLSKSEDEVLTGAAAVVAAAAGLLLEVLLNMESKLNGSSEDFVVAVVRSSSPNIDLEAALAGAGAGAAAGFTAGRSSSSPNMDLETLGLGASGCFAGAGAAGSSSNMDLETDLAGSSLAGAGLASSALGLASSVALAFVVFLGLVSLVSASPSVSFDLVVAFLAAAFFLGAASGTSPKIAAAASSDLVSLQNKRKSKISTLLTGYQSF